MMYGSVQSVHAYKDGTICGLIVTYVKVAMRD
jgi:hypothetical protein